MKGLNPSVVRAKPSAQPGTCSSSPGRGSSISVYLPSRSQGGAHSKEDEKEVEVTGAEQLLAGTHLSW